ncbi:MAG: nucleotide exchange factor GrpE [candidate division KSB1 bacterium]|nr:nucleotide exchange factor GrpE [candidate division KSB1 bacterium]
MTQAETVQNNVEPIAASKKKRNYKKELEAALAERDALKEMLLRTAAEFDNYRKRIQQEKAELVESANAGLIKKLLPVLDDLNRLCESTAEKAQEDPVLQGIELIRRNFTRILEDEGVREMKTKGEPFDPERHEALMLVEAEGVPPNTVVEEHQRGYEYKEKILRHARVIVSKEKD